MSFDCDVAVVGGGPAGLSAALMLGRACRTVMVFDEGRPRNGVVRHIHGFLSRDGIDPLELLKIARQELEKYQSIQFEQSVVTDARCLNPGFEITLGTGRTCRSRKLLIATGVEDRLPDVPGLAERYGTSVFHCPFCDAWEVRGQPLAVYGQGERGYGLSLELLGWTHNLVLCTDGPARLDDRRRIDLARHGIIIREAPISRLEGPDGTLERIVFMDGETLTRRAMFFTTGQHQASPLAGKLGCEFNDKGTVSTGRHESTKVPGLYVAGDASRDVQWVVIAAAEGAEAAYAMTLDLLAEDRNAMSVAAI
jgi:thioredoxin reductase